MLQAFQEREGRRKGILYFYLFIYLFLEFLLFCHWIKLLHIFYQEQACDCIPGSAFHFR